MITMHPRIKELFESLQEKHINSPLSRDTFEFLKEIGSTQTEAIVTLHLGFNISLESAQNAIYESNIWEYEDLNEIAFQTFKYL